MLQKHIFMTSLFWIKEQAMKFLLSLPNYTHTRTFTWRSIRHPKLWEYIVGLETKSLQVHLLLAPKEVENIWFCREFKQPNITTVSSSGWMPQQDECLAQHTTCELQNSHLHMSLNEDEQKKPDFSTACMSPFGLDSIDWPSLPKMKGRSTTEL